MPLPSLPVLAAHAHLLWRAGECHPRCRPNPCRRLCAAERSLCRVGADFSGNFTHIGKFQGLVDINAQTAVWTAANGDTITNQTIFFETFEEVSPGVFRYEQTLIITGGTGRVANATGNATATGLINGVTGAYDGVLVGTISRPNRS